jgi:hypothetical protein
MYSLSSSQSQFIQTKDDNTTVLLEPELSYQGDGYTNYVVAMKSIQGNYPPTIHTIEMDNTNNIVPTNKYSEFKDQPGMELFSVDDNIITKFYIGSLGFISLYVFYCLWNKNK